MPGRNFVRRHGVPDIMAWLILSFLIYLLVLLSERALVGLSPHDLEQLRADSTRSSRLTYSLALQVRPVLAALLLARLLLKTGITVFIVLRLAQDAALRTGLYNLSTQTALPGWLVWGLASLGLALVLATMFWALKRLNRRPLSGYFARSIAQQLGVFMLFWKLLFAPFLPKNRAVPAAEGLAKVPPQAAASANPPHDKGEKQRDIELLKSIVKFSDVTVKQVMQPRSKVVGVYFRTTFGDLLRTVREAGFSRMPVYDEDLDNVTGILYVKDLVPYLDAPDDFEWQPLIRTNVLLVPEAKRISELLQDFKRNKRHMAIVVDEYGGSAGIVTMEDILEEITGEIRDEFDEESEIRYRKLDDHNYLFEGQTLLNDVCRIAGLAPDTFDAERGAADTLAGLALELKGDIPSPGTELSGQGYLLTVVAADNRRIEQLKLTLVS